MASIADVASKIATIAPCTVCPGHTKAVVELFFSEPSGEDDAFFLSACLDKLPMLRFTSTGNWAGTFSGHQGAVWSAKLNKGATLAATGSADFTAKVWDACSGDLLATLEHRHVVKSVDFSHASTRLATGGGDKLIRVFTVAGITSASEPALSMPHPDKIRRLLWAPNDTHIVTGSEEGILRLWNVATGACDKTLTVGAPGEYVYDIELSRDGKTLTVSVGNSVVLVNLASFDIVKRLDLTCGIEAASLHPSGLYVAVGGTDVLVKVFEVETGRLLATNRGHHGIVHCVRFAPDGKSYASGADDATIRIWDFAPPATA